MVEYETVAAIADRIVEKCRAHTESRIKTTDIDKIFAEHKLLPRRPIPLTHRSRGSYTGMRRAIHDLVKSEMKRRGLLLERVAHKNKNEVAIYQMTDGKSASIKRLRDDPAMIPKRTKRLAQEMRRFLNLKGLQPDDLPKDKQDMLIKMLNAEAEDAATGLRRRFDFALEISGVPMDKLLESSAT